MSELPMAEMLSGRASPASGLSNVARIYDALLNGKDNHAAGRPAARSLLAAVPDAARAAHDNRFLISLTTVCAAPHAARCQSRIILAEWNVSPEHADIALLLISELVTNAVRFGKAPGMPPPSKISLTLLRTREILVIEVSDQSAGIPVRRPAGPGSESGRGLNMVHELSHQWGFYAPCAGWKTVYCAIRIPGGCPGAERSQKERNERQVHG